MHALIFTNRALDVLVAPTEVQYTVVGFSAVEGKNATELSNLLKRRWDEIVIEVTTETVEPANRILQCWRCIDCAAPVTYLRQVGCQDHKNVVLASKKGVVITVLDSRFDVYGALFKKVLSETHGMVRDLMAKIIDTMLTLAQCPIYPDQEAGLRLFYARFGKTALEVLCRNDLREAISIQGLHKTTRIPPGETHTVGDFYDPVYTVDGQQKPSIFGMDGAVYVAHDPAIKLDNALPKETGPSPKTAASREINPAPAAENPKTTPQEAGTEDVELHWWWRITNLSSGTVIVRFADGTEKVLVGQFIAYIHGTRPVETVHKETDGCKIVLPIVDGHNRVLRAEQLYREGS